MSHYFINDTSVKSELRHFTHEYKGRVYEFVSDNGLFSKEHIDYASNLLIQSVGELSGSLLDMGCGYGTMGIMLAGAFGLTLTLADVNEKALSYAEINCEKNGIQAECMLSDCFHGITEQYHTIVINPPIHAGKSVIYSMYEQSREHLFEGGSLYIVIQKKHGAESSREKLLDVFGNCTIIYKKKGFFVFQCVKNI